MRTTASSQLSSGESSPQPNASVRQIHADRRTMSLPPRSYKALRSNTCVGRERARWAVSCVDRLRHGQNSLVAALETHALHHEGWSDCQVHAHVVAVVAGDTLDDHKTPGAEHATQQVGAQDVSARR